jgi:hypothetical protein
MEKNKDFFDRFLACHSIPEIPIYFFPLSKPISPFRHFGFFFFRMCCCYYCQFFPEYIYALWKLIACSICFIFFHYISYFSQLLDNLTDTQLVLH